RVLEQEERPPEAAQPPIEGTLGGQTGKQGTEVLVSIAKEASLALPGNATAPLRRQPQAQHLAVAQRGGRPATSGHLRPDMGLIQVIDHDVQCGEEGFQIEVHGSLSFRQQRVPERPRRNPSSLLPEGRDQYASSV